MDEETEFTKLPIEERCQHKLWKARVNGYEEATKQFQQQTDEKHPEFGKYLGLVKKFVVDSNAAAQEKGLVAVLAYAENAAVAGKTCGEVMNGIVTKCLGAPRTKTKELAVEIALMYIEIEKHEVVQDELIKGLDNKTPKVVAACITVLKEALRLYGIKVINIKPLMKLLPKILEDRDKTVREEAKLLTVEIYRWIKDAIKPLLQSLKPVQITELEAEFAKVSDEVPAPTRYLRSQQNIQARVVETADGEEEVDTGETTGAAEAIDPYEFLEAVNLLAKMPKDFYEQVEAKKWQERKDVLEALLPLATSPKLEAGDYSDLVRTLKKLVSKDSNVLVVALAAKCIAGLAIGLRKKFHSYAGQCIPAILEKFKEKKQNVVNALKEAIDAIYPTTTLEAVLEDVQAALDNKNPQIKSETAAFLARAFTKATPTVLNKKLLKPICASLTKTLNDTDPVVRDTSCEALGTAMKVVGEKSIMPFLQDVEKHKMDKVKEMCEKAVIVAAPVPSAPKAKPPPPTARVAPAVRSAPTDNISTQPEAPRPATAPARKIPGAAARSKGGVAGKGAKPASAGAIGRKGGKANEPPAEVIFTEKELSDEEIQMQMEEMLSADIITGLGSSVWKDRLTAMEKFNEIVQGMEKENLPSQLLVRVLAKKPGFKENNIQILKLKFDILTNILENGKISRTTAGFCLSDLVDKVGDAKNGPAAMSALTSMAEAISLDFISLEVLQLAFAQRNPKNQAEALNWLGNAIKEFGFKIQMKGVLEYLKKGLAHTNPAVRTATISLLSVIYMYMGKTLRTLFEDEKPALLQQIDSELAKVQDVKPPPATRGLKKAGSAAAIGQEDVEEPQPESINLADIVPRVDLSVMITQTVLTEMEDKNWKVRAEALQKVANILQDAKFVQPEVGDLPSALKSRLTDSNKNIAVQAINICQSLGVALGPHCNRHIRALVPGLLSSMGDLKNNVRSAAVTCLNSWLENCSINCVFEGEMISDSLKTENPTLRQELLGWLAEKLPTAKALPTGELSLCLPYLFSCLEDRSADVRKKASDAVLPFMIHLGFEPMARAASKLKPASKSSVMPQLEKARPYLPVKAAPPSAKAKANLPPSPTGNEKGSDEVTQGTKRIPRSSSKSKIATKSAGASSASSGGRPGKKDDEDLSPSLAVNNLKDQRMIDEKNIKTLRWNFTSPREEYYTLLRDLMTTANWNTGLINSCFSNDFKQHLKALDILLAFLSGNLDATKANLDLILKWLALRFFDTNPSVLLKGLEYLQQLFPVLAANEYRMTEVESSSFIPYLILKIGDPKDPVRKGVHDILHQIFHVYPATKVFTYIMQGLSSKNARQRAECLEELGFMIESFGMVVCQPSPPVALKEIAKQISDRDNGVRTAALNCVVQAYFIEGEKVYKYVGHLSDKDMSLLEERIKRSAKPKNQAPPAPEPVNPPPHIPSYHSSPPGFKGGSPLQQGNRNENIDPSATIRIHKTRPALRPQSISGIQLETEKIEQEYCKGEISPRQFPPTINMSDDANELLNMPDVKLPKTSLRPTASAVKLLNSSDNAEMALNLVLAQLAATDIPVVVEAFAQVEEVLHQEDKAEAAMASRVDQLLLMGALQYRMAHNKHMADENICKADVIKLYRCVTMTLTTLFGHKTLPKKASRDVLRDLIPHLVTVILDSRLNELLDGPQVVRSLNMLVIRIIQKGNPTQVMSALIKLLFDCVGNMSASDRHTELIMKCLWKMLRLMDTYIVELNVDHILLEVHQFLKMYPSSFWKEKKGSDTPLRTIKTLLFHLVQHKGEDILKHLVLIPNRQESDLVSYLNKMLNSEKTGSSSRLSQNGSMEILGSGKKPKHSPMRLSKTNHETLAEIFKKIGDKEHTKEGLLELYEFRKQHPTDNIEPFLQKSSEFFQNYIRRGLNSIEQDRTQKSQSTVYSTTTTLNANVSDTICQIPAVDASPLDYIEYLKTLAARLQVDGSKYSDPAFLQQLMDSAKAAKENKDSYKEDIEASAKAFEEMKSMFEADTGIKISR